MRLDARMVNTARRYAAEPRLVSLGERRVELRDGTVRWALSWKYPISLAGHPFAYTTIYLTEDAYDRYKRGDGHGR